MSMALRTSICKTSFCLWILCVFFFHSSQAQQITIWGSTHGIGMNKTSECSKQNELLYDQMKTDPHWIGGAIPDLIFAPETVAQNDKSESLLSIDDDVIHHYISWFYVTKSYLQFVKRSLKNPSVTNALYYDAMTKDFFGRMLWNEADKITSDITKRVLIRDKLKPYMTYLNEDFEKVFSRIEKRPLTKKTFDSGLLFLIEQYYKYHDQEFIKKINETLTAYGELSKNIAEIYFNENVKPYAKYNIVIENADSPMNGKKAFDIAKPLLLFNEYNYFNKPDENFEAASVDWRNHFIAQNIFSIMKSSPDANLLVWFGDAHTQGVVRNLLKLQPTDEEIQKINVINMKSNDSLACNFTEVLRTMYEKKGAMNISDWSKTYGDQDYQNPVTVYDLNGKIVYQDNDYYWSTKQDVVEGKIMQALKKENKIGIFLVEIQSSRGKHIATYKIIMM